MEPKKLKIKQADIVIPFDVPGLLKASEMFKAFARGNLKTLEISTETQKVIIKKI